MRALSPRFPGMCRADAITANVARTFFTAERVTVARGLSMGRAVAIKVKNVSTGLIHAENNGTRAVLGLPLFGFC